MEPIFFGNLKLSWNDRTGSYEDDGCKIEVYKYGPTSVYKPWRADWTGPGEGSLGDIGATSGRGDTPQEAVDALLKNFKSWRDLFQKTIDIAELG